MRPSFLTIALGCCGICLAIPIQHKILNGKELSPDPSQVVTDHISPPSPTNVDDPLSDVDVDENTPEDLELFRESLDAVENALDQFSGRQIPVDILEQISETLEAVREWQSSKYPEHIAELEQELLRLRQAKDLEVDGGASGDELANEVWRQFRYGPNTPRGSPRTSTAGTEDTGISQGEANSIAEFDGQDGESDLTLEVSVEDATVDEDANGHMILDNEDMAAGNDVETHLDHGPSSSSGSDMNSSPSVQEANSRSNVAGGTTRAGSASPETQTKSARSDVIEEEDEEETSGLPDAAADEALDSEGHGGLDGEHIRAIETHESQSRSMPESNPMRSYRHSPVRSSYHGMEEFEEYTGDVEAATSSTEGVLATVMSVFGL